MIINLSSVNRTKLATLLDWDRQLITRSFTGKRDTRITEVYLIAKALNLRPGDLLDTLLVQRAKYMQRKRIKKAVEQDA